LAERVLSGTATETEIALLHEWYDAADKEDIELVFTPQRETEDEIRQRTFAGLQQAIEQTPKPAPRRIGRYATWIAAASVLGALVFTGKHLWNVRQSAKAACCVVSQETKPKKDLLPGGNKATLLLGDGAVVDLGNAKNGLIRNAAGTRIDKKDGQLIYDASAAATGSIAARAPEMNTIQTPRGGQYQLILPDGTKVWLDAASSLSYPTAFTGKERQVQLKGEAYFEVAEDKNKPFTVLAGDVRVNVLGTHFNVMAYDDENAIKTTLLEGAVKVTRGQASHLLEPGQEASCDKASGSFRTLDVDADEAIAWKNGYFRFAGVPIETVMRQIARWYDVEVEYQGTTSEHFRGTISRSSNVSEVFKMLELTGAVHFSIEGKKIIVKP
jgi:ferric-dicitrate binding protein FerR (iron transport regulator)